MTRDIIEDEGLRRGERTGRLMTVLWLAAAAVCVAVPALARSPEALETRKVAYGDLNLATASGVAVLDHRIEDAVTRLCGQVDPREQARYAAQARCRAETRASVQPARAALIANARPGSLRLASAR